MSKNFVVIGSNSFSGASFVKHLLKKGHKVLGCGRSQEPHHAFLPYRWITNDQKNFEFIKCDLNIGTDKLISKIKQLNASHIVNFSALGMVAQSWEKPDDWYQTNVVAQVKLHDKLRKENFIEKYVHVTTPEVYGSTDGWISESSYFKPSTPYAVSRAACDLHLNSFFQAYNFPVVFTRSANVYGAGQQLYRIIPRTILYARLGKKMELHGGGNSERSFIHIDDVADATCRVALSGVPGKAYHISTKKTITIRDLVIKICNLLNVEITDLVKDTDDRLGKDQSYSLNSDLIRTELEWQDQIELNKGILSTIEWIDSNIETLKNLPYHYIHKP